MTMAISESNGEEKAAAGVCQPIMAYQRQIASATQAGSNESINESDKLINA